jgi:hypothetical protein
MPKNWDVDPKRAEFFEPFVVVKSADKWYYADEVPDDVSENGDAMISTLDEGMGIKLRAAMPHVYAKGLFSPHANSPTKHGAAFDPRDMIATVAVECDEVLQVWSFIQGPANPGGRILVINIPDAELWWVTPETILSLSPLQMLEREPDAHDHARIRRDDSPRLRRIAALAVKWYSVRRQAVHMERVGLTIADAPGVFLTVTVASWTRETVGAVITSRHHDYDRRRTTIQTDFDPPDFASIAP